jgi:hypothetical protein
MKFIKRKNIDTYLPKSQRFSVEVDGRAIIGTDKSLTVPIGNTSARPDGVPGMIRYNNTTGYNDFEVFTGYASWGWEKIRTDRPSDIFISEIGVGDGDGTVDSIEIVDGGAGYTEAPTLEISSPDIGNDVATAVAIVEDGSITEVQITNAGDGYITIPTVTILGANTTAELNVVLTGGLEYELPAGVIPVDSTGSVSSTNIQVYIENVFQLPTINYIVIQSGGTASVKFDAPVPFGKPVYVIYGYDR